MAETSQDVVRAWDKDRYLAALFAPDDKRQYLFALYAFDAEIARIRTLVSETQIGEIRMQWWADTLDVIDGGGAIDHPLAQSLSATIKLHGLPTKHLQQVIDARRAELYADQFPDIFSLESYVAETDAIIMQCAALILDKDAATASAATIGNYATAFGLARLTVNEALRTKLIPPSIGLEAIRTLAQKRLKEARTSTIPKQLLPAVLPSSLTEIYLSGKASALRKQWTLWRSARSGRI
jgi:15-cis-phytoene synthase